MMIVVVLVMTVVWFDCESTRPSRETLTGDGSARQFKKKGVHSKNVLPIDDTKIFNHYAALTAELRKLTNIRKKSSFLYTNFLPSKKVSIC